MTVGELEDFIERYGPAGTGQLDSDTELRVHATIRIDDQFRTIALDLDTMSIAHEGVAYLVTK